MYYSNNNTPTQLALQSIVASIQNTVNNLQNNSYTSSNKPYVIGYYQGNGDGQRTILLGFTPICVLVMYLGRMTTDDTTNGRVYGGLAITGHSVLSGNEHVGLSIITNGFWVYTNSYNYTYTNLNNEPYHYIAFK